MIDPISIAGSLAQISSLITSFPKSFYLVTSDVIGYSRLYGISGFIVWWFGSKNVWRMQAQVLGGLKDEDAMAFRKSIQDECTMTAVAGAIIAQIAVTALSLPFLSQTHWVARGFWVFSLTSGIMAVYCASAQQRTMGRLLYPKQVRSWIRGAADSVAQEVLLRQEKAIVQYFLPSAASVVNISAPTLLLSASLNSFLIGLGVYLGFVWQRNLDISAEIQYSKDVFITYTVSVGVSYATYNLSSLVQEDQAYENPWLIVFRNVGHAMQQHGLSLRDHDLGGAKPLTANDPAHYSNDGQKSGFEALSNVKGSSSNGPVVNLMRPVPNESSSQAAFLPLNPSNPAPYNVHRPAAVSLSQGSPTARREIPDQQILIRALQDSARLRRELAKVEELTAEYYEHLLESQPSKTDLPAWSK